MRNSNSVFIAVSWLWRSPGCHFAHPFWVAGWLRVILDPSFQPIQSGNLLVPEKLGFRLELEKRLLRCLSHKNMSGFDRGETAGNERFSRLVGVLFKLLWGNPPRMLFPAARIWDSLSR